MKFWVKGFFLSYFLKFPQKSFRAKMMKFAPCYAIKRPIIQLQPETDYFFVSTLTARKFLRVKQSLIGLIKLSRFLIKGKDLYTCCSALRGKPMSCTCLRITCIFFLVFCRMSNIASPSTIEHGSCWVTNIRLFFERWSCKHRNFSPNGIFLVFVG